MAPRATWKGYLKLAELAIPVALYAAATTSKRISFNIINRQTGNRVSREYIDEETQKPVEREKQVKGYEISKDQYVILKPEEIAAAVPESDKTIRVEAFIPCPEVDAIYFDRPYFVAPPESAFADAYAVLCEGMRRKQVAALGRAVLFRRVRAVMLRTEGAGLIGHTLNYDYEVRSAEEAFGGLSEIRIEGEMLDLARHIIETKAGKFDPREFDDRYDKALAELVKAKMEGREIVRPKPRPEPKVANLLDALRESARAAKPQSGRSQAPKMPATATRRRKTAASSKPRRKAG